MPEELRPDVERQIKALVEQLYNRQEAQIRQRFAYALSAGAATVDLSNLPFDIISQRLAEVSSALNTNLGGLQSYIADKLDGLENRDTMLIHLFVSLFSCAMDESLELSSILSANSLYAVALGWNINNQHQIDAIRIINRLTTDLDNYQTGETRITLAEARKIVEFLDYAAQKGRCQTVVNQLRKLLQISAEGAPLQEESRARAKLTGYLTELRRAFKDIDLGRLKAFVDNPEGHHELGDARPLAVFLTDDVEMLKTKERVIPEGEDVVMPEGGISLSSVAQCYERMPEDVRQEDGEVEALIGALSSPKVDSRSPLLGEPDEKVESEILDNITVQGPPGTYTREITQNSLDATRGQEVAGEVVIDFYLQQNSLGELEYVEEAKDNGTGALKEIALIIPLSTKAVGRQFNLAGFFGTGKYTIFEGVNRVEMVTCNGSRAYMFTFVIIRDSSGKPQAVRLSGIRRLNKEQVTKGVTVRRIKSAQNSIPELDQRISQRAWEMYAGLAKDGNFRIYFVDHEGNKHPLEVEHEILSEIEFKANKPGEQAPTSFGTMRIISAKDMPLQIIDKNGLRVCELKEEYLALIPWHLRGHIKELGIIIQIPLPLIHNRSGFKDESHYLAIIQKYIAIEFYKAIAFKALTQTSPQFVFEGFPMDWETNDDYWRSIDLRDRYLTHLAENINKGNYGDVSIRQLEVLLTQEGLMDKEKIFVKLILLLQAMVRSNPEKPAVRMSLYSRRLAIQRAIDAQRAQAEEEKLKQLGYATGKIPAADEISHYSERVDQALSVQEAHRQMQDKESLAVEPRTPQEFKLMELAGSIAKLFGLEQIVLMSEQAQFAGAFGYFKGKSTIFIKRTISLQIGTAWDGGTDKAIDTIIHELGHWLEEIMESDDIQRQAVLTEGYTAHPSNFTHDSVGTFAEAMKYAAAVTLANHGRQASQPSEAVTGSVIASEPRSGERSNPMQRITSCLPKAGEPEETKAPRNDGEDEARGGIDFTGLPIVSQAIGNLTEIFRDSPLYADETIRRGQSLQGLRLMDLDEELTRIKNMVEAGIEPSPNRILEFLQTQALRNEEIDIDKVILCIADILRQEEETCLPANPLMRDILVVLESGQDMRQIFLVPANSK